MFSASGLKMSTMSYNNLLDFEVMKNGPKRSYGLTQESISRNKRPKTEHLSIPLPFSLPLQDLTTFFKFEELPLEPRDLFNVSLTSRKWYHIISNDSKLWKRLCSKRWKNCVPNQSRAETWKELYKRYLTIESEIANSDTPGATAISYALQEVHDTIPAYYKSPVQKRSLEPVAVISVHSVRDCYTPHWHYVTWGLSELNSRDGSNYNGISGWGFELSFRLPMHESRTTHSLLASDEQRRNNNSLNSNKSLKSNNSLNAPEWPIRFLQSLARYVRRTGNVFGNGDHMPLSKSLAGSRISALLFTHDPQLKNEWKNPNGAFHFIEVVGIMADELEAAVAWNKKSFLHLLAKCTNNPLMITYLHRQSLLERPEIARLLKHRTEKEGSTQGLLFVEKMRYHLDKDSRVMALEIPPLVIPDLLKMLKGRINYLRDFFLVNTVTDSVVNFVPAENGQSSCWQLEDNQQLTITVSADLTVQLEDRLSQVIGNYSFPSLQGFVLRVVDICTL